MTINELFDLVAPIAICGGTDVQFQKKAVAAWKKIRKIDPAEWTQHGCAAPPVQMRGISNSDDFDQVYNEFAVGAYNALFEAIVSEHGPAALEKGYDYWGAMGYKLPHQGSKNFELSGDSPGQYPWYETAELLIERLQEIEV